MATVENRKEDRKKDMIENAVQTFQKLNRDDQLLIIGYMLGVEDKSKRAETQPQTA